MSWYSEYYEKSGSKNVGLKIVIIKFFISDLVYLEKSRQTIKFESMNLVLMILNDI